MRRRMCRFKASALIDRDVNENSTLRNKFEHVARHQFRSRRTDDQHGSDNKIGMRDRFFDRVSRRSHRLHF